MPINSKAHFSNNRNRKSIQAGSFSIWLRNIRISLLEGRGMEVPCGECDACCRSSQFIHIKPGEIHALKRIPKDLLFPAPLLPKGYMVLGYNKNGRCPMLGENECSIYRDRPATCRSFDCRVLAASGVKVFEKRYKLIMQQAERWKFSYSTDRDRKLHSAIKNAATFLTKHLDTFPANWVSSNSIQLAVFSIMVYNIFMDTSLYKIDRTNYDTVIDKKVLKAYEKFGRLKCSNS